MVPLSVHVSDYSYPPSEVSIFSYGFLVLVDSFTLKTSWGPGYPYQLAPCTVSADLEVIPFWRKDDDNSMFIPL